MKNTLLLRALLAACGDTTTSEEPCRITLSGDVTGTYGCRIFLCYPTSGEYQSLDIARSIDGTLLYGLIPEVKLPTTFRPGRYTLADLRPESQLRMEANGKRYGARGTTPNTTDERATLTLSDVTAPFGDDVCSGTVRGMLHVEMVELLSTPGIDTVGAGRVTADVTMK